MRSLGFDAAFRRSGKTSSPAPGALKNLKWLMVVAAGTMCLAGEPASARDGWVTCTGVLVEVDMADTPTAVIYDYGAGSSETHSCVVELGHSSLKGICRSGQACTITGRYFEQTNNIYHIRKWDSAEAAASYHASNDSRSGE